MALNIPDLFTRELKAITERGVPAPKILVSDRAQIVMPYHILLDTYEEERLAGQVLRIHQVRHRAVLFRQVREDRHPGERAVRRGGSEEKVERHLHDQERPARASLSQAGAEPDEIMEELHGVPGDDRALCADTSAFLERCLKEGKNILLEGQLGSLKDPDHGIYPMVTFLLHAGRLRRHRRRHSAL